MQQQQIITTTQPAEELERLLNTIQYDRLFLLTDEHTHQACLPILKGVQSLKDAPCITIQAGDNHKDIDSLTQVWEGLCKGNATRHSILINIGGGMVTDLGGFAAATYKRGIRFINIPTSLLAMVDASVGGKTGINFHSLKNEIGSFCPAHTVIIASTFLQTLDTENLRSGFAEMLKHGLISTPQHWSELMNVDLQHPNEEEMLRLIKESVSIKENIVQQDPTEQNIRKALNFGHTLGHAFETLSLRRGTPCLHGYAVAWGIIGELYLSHQREGFPQNILRQTIQFIRETYGSFAFDCKVYDDLYALMLHDKKNVGTEIRFTLLGGIGDIRINRTATKEEIFEMLDFYREACGC